MIRLYIEAPLFVAASVTVSKDQRHYLEKVMRIQNDILLFNGKDGEFIATYVKGVLNLHTQTQAFQALPKKALAFGLIKKHRLAWMMEKACELGATDLYPLITKHVQFKEFNPERYTRILIEAAEQCGRMDLPELHSVGTLAELARQDFNWQFGSINASSHGIDMIKPGFIVGPEGGLTAEEEAQIATYARPLSMGPLILRTETAAVWGLAQGC